ncbi:MAG: AFG1 family ATPase [Candidatus Polarisedimenticolaceae bacterium]|nr:AFG1 family ATPase [Candidatus Polarisedimenticolaceae bacterium]
MHISATTNAHSSPQTIYSEQLQHGALDEDCAQRAVVNALQELHDQLLTATQVKPPSLSERILSWNRPQTKSAPHGLYIWGGVGRGKTWLMDIFFDSLPIKKKQRLHFHHFMHSIHSELAQLKGERDPLDIVAADFSRHTQVLCLDELYVSDIGDAMLLGQLLKGLFHHGITLVTTSNTPPDHLYQDGLQRLAFLPTITLIKEHMQSIELGGSTDYRLRYLESAKIYHTPLHKDSNKLLQEEFEHLAMPTVQAHGSITIERREIPFISQAADTIWFDFDTLCGGPRASADYMEIAARFHTVILSNIPLMNDEHIDCMRRFVNLVDEFYDRNVKLIISAAETPDKLYQGKRMAFEYRRTASRLQEMQSRVYLAKSHKQK